MLTTRLNPALPRLAWVGVLDRRTAHVHVMHGSSVETGAGFVVEGVWDGDFDAGDFHHAEHFFGSGIVHDEEGWWIVPSRALVDRVICCEYEESVVVSNSLPLLLAHNRARLDDTWNYRAESYAILKGIDDYDPSLRILDDRNGRYTQAYFHPLLVTPTGLVRQPLAQARSFGSYTEYRTALDDALRRIRANYQSSARRVRMDAYTTISRGYDSTATTSLVREFGLAAAFTSRRSNSSILPWMSREAAIDDGSEIARHWRLDVRYLEGSRVSEDELYFLAPTCADAETVFAPLAEHIEARSSAAVLFSGFHGDKLWDTGTSGKYLDTSIHRGDTSGLNLGEIRLKAGFVNVAIPFMFARSAHDIVGIARSAEMNAWSVGGDYDRPIPRRIVEETGIDRTAFGTRKKAVVQSYNYPKNPGLRRIYFEWLKSRTGRTRMAAYGLEKINTLAFLMLKTAERAARIAGLRVPEAPRVVAGRDIDMPYELHKWALEELTQRFAGLLVEHGALHAAGATLAPNEHSAIHPEGST